MKLLRWVFHSHHSPRGFFQFISHLPFDHSTKRILGLLPNVTLRMHCQPFCSPIPLANHQRDLGEDKTNVYLALGLKCLYNFILKIPKVVTEYNKQTKMKIYFFAHLLIFCLIFLVCYTFCWSRKQSSSVRP